jgi:sugar lactone lactonase YvrE
MATSAELDVVIDGLTFAEAPRWHDGELYVSDVHGGSVLALSDAGARVVVEIDDSPCGLGWLPGGAMLVVSMNHRRLLRVDGDDLTVHADLAPHAAYAINDMVVDTRGRAYVSQVGFDFHAGGAPADSPLLVVAPDGDVTPTAFDLAVANGLALDPTGATMLVAETLAGRVTELAVGPDGMLRRTGPFATLGPGSLPDGICLDRDGAAWVACPELGRVVRVGRGGAVLDVVQLPAGRRAMACVLGDDDRRTLYVCTTGTRRPPERWVADRTSRVERCRVAVPGAGLP